MTPTINVPLPSPRSKRPSESPIHQSNSHNLSWYHLISVAFRDTLTERLSRTPTATQPEDAEVSERWKQMCKDKNISSAPFGTDDAGFSLELDGPIPDDNPVEPVVGEEDIPELAAEQDEATATTSSPTRRRRPGRPRGSVKRPPPAITAARRTLRNLSDISDHQWGSKQSAAAPSTISEDTATQSLRRSGRRSLKRKSEPYSFCTSEPLPSSGDVAERSHQPPLDVHSEPEPPRKLRKPPTPRQLSTPNIIFYFTVLPKPQTRPSGSASTSFFSFRFSSFQPYKRTLTSDKLVMLCMRAHVRLQGRLKDKGAGSTPGKPSPPNKPWLRRNIRTMVKKLAKKGKQIPSKVLEAGNSADSADAQTTALPTPDIPREDEETETTVRRRGRKRKRKTL
ncbi:hypothetical protein H072_4183 [Dactylellina haptotyla CBS 200.50]|uniref:Uncharacterized protein n=1 Tax=Dactylellina haptotyla (strain CBS 200.50) TaxID=1284197 RepID=S8C2K3_DACHA|nr:hypothetical protein H072_4183 [Dactylellina haptotyla CBS 200.50]